MAHREPLGECRERLFEAGAGAVVSVGAVAGSGSHQRNVVVPAAPAARRETQRKKKKHTHRGRGELAGHAARAGESGAAADLSSERLDQGGALVAKLAGASGGGGGG